MPDALIVGAGGFLGRHLVRRLVDSGWRVASLGFRTSSPLPGETRHVAPALTAEAISHALPPGHFDAVYLLAAAGVDPAQRQPADLFAGNILLPRLLLEALAGRSLGRIILTGTCSEYFPLTAHRLSDEFDPIEGADAYGASKSPGALWARRLARELGLPLTTLRLFHFYGAGEAPYRLVSSLFRQLSLGQPVPLSPGQQHRDFLYVEDVLDALEAARLAPAGEVFNVCSSHPVTVAGIARAAAKVLGRPESLLQFGALDYRPGEVMWIAGDNRRFRQATGWSPRWPFERGLAAMRELS